MEMSTKRLPKMAAIEVGMFRIQLMTCGAELLSLSKAIGSKKGHKFNIPSVLAM